MAFTFFYVFYGIKADDTGKSPIDIDTENKPLPGMDLTAEAWSNRGLIQIFYDYYCAESGSHYVRNSKGIGPKFLSKLVEILNMEEDRRRPMDPELAQRGFIEREPREYKPHLEPAPWLPKHFFKERTR